MINQAKINNAINKTRNINIDRLNQSFIIIPYDISGYIDYSNHGIILNSQRNPNDYETFKRVWSGNDAVIINWKGSMLFTQNPDTKKIETTYKFGDFIAGELLDNTSNIDISEDKSFSDYKTQQEEVNLQFRVSMNYHLTSNYNYLFYKIPELYGSMLFRVVSIDTTYLGLTPESQVLNLKSINQELSNTGKAKQQNIMPNAPGQGYIEPQVFGIDAPSTYPDFDKLVVNVDYKQFYDRYIIINRDKEKNRPISRVEVKLYGAACLSSFSCVGRSVELGGDFKEFGIPRLVFPYKLEETQLPTLFRTQSVETNFYAGFLAPEVLNTKDSMTWLKDIFTPLNKWDNQGLFEYKLADMRSTQENTTASAIPYKYSLSGWTDTIGGSSIRFPWKFIIYSTTLKLGYMSGMADDYSFGGERTIENHMLNWYFAQKNMKILPISKRSSLGFGFAIGSSIGALITKQWWAGALVMLVGIAGMLITKISNQRINNGFYGVVPSELIELNNQYSKTTTEKYNQINAKILSSSEDNPASIYFDSNTMCVGFNSLLTDSFTRLDVPIAILNFSNVGQTKFEDGTPIFPKEPDKYFLLNGNEVLTYNNPTGKRGFIIDSFQIQAIFSGDYEVNFIDLDGNVEWSGVYQSEGKWTKSMREIWSEEQCSIFGRENFYFSEPLPYPTELPPPDFPVPNPIDLTFAVNPITLGDYCASNITNTWTNGELSTFNGGSFYYKEQGFIKDFLILKGFDKDVIVKAYERVLLLVNDEFMSKKDAPVWFEKDTKQIINYNETMEKFIVDGYEKIVEFNSWTWNTQLAPILTNNPWWKQWITLGKIEDNAWPQWNRSKGRIIIRNIWEEATKSLSIRLEVQFDGENTIKFYKNTILNGNYTLKHGNNPVSTNMSFNNFQVIARKQV